MKQKQFPFCKTDDISTSEQKMNQRRKYFTCREKESIKIYETAFKKRNISLSNPIETVIGERNISLSHVTENF